MARPLRICTTNGCSEIVKSGKCQSCRRAVSKVRNKITQPRYDDTWRVISLEFRRHFPLCFVCGAQATEVDHIDGNTSNRSWENLASYCKRHHAMKTAKYDGSFGRVALDGLPLDD